MPDSRRLPSTSRCTTPGPAAWACRCTRCSVGRSGPASTSRWALGAAPVDEILEEAHAKDRSPPAISPSSSRWVRSTRPSTPSGSSRSRQSLDGQAGVSVDVNARWDRFTALRYLPQLADGGVELDRTAHSGRADRGARRAQSAVADPIMADEIVQHAARRPRDRPRGCRRRHRPQDHQMRWAATQPRDRRDRQGCRHRVPRRHVHRGARSAPPRRSTSPAPNRVSTSEPNCSALCCSASNCFRNP